MTPQLKSPCALQRGQKCDNSNNFWEYYEEDIARVVSLKATVFRLSLGAPPFVLGDASLRIMHILKPCNEQQESVAAQ